MKLCELREATKNIDLQAIGVVLGSISLKPGTVCCFQEDDNWVMKIIDDDGNVSERRGMEEHILRKVYAVIRSRSKPSGVSPGTIGQESMEELLRAFNDQIEYLYTTTHALYGICVVGMETLPSGRTEKFFYQYQVDGTFRRIPNT